MGERGQARGNICPMNQRRGLRLVLGFSPGSFSDRIARLISAPLAQALARPVSIELRPGHNGVPAACDVAAAAPDGSVLFMATLGTHALAPARTGKAPYDPLRDFACVSLVAKSPLLLACNTDLDIGSVSALIARAIVCKSFTPAVPPARR